MSATGIVGKSKFGNGNHPAEYRRVYVWELPVRAYHWINAIALVLLCVTGYLIGAPIRAFYAAKRISSTGLAGCASFTSSARTCMSSTSWRVFTGDLWATSTRKWNNFFPITKAQRQEIVDVIKTDVSADEAAWADLDRTQRAGRRSSTSSLFWRLWRSRSPALHLYSSMSNSLIPRMFTWIVPLMGGEMSVRYWHHLFLWFFVTFIVVHVYLAFYHDYIEGRGTISSIVGGWKFDRVKPEKRDRDKD